MALNPDEKMNMTYSTVLTKDGKPLISVAFQRENDRCEGIIPDCKIVNNKGFDDDEIAALEYYLRTNKKQIINDSKSISSLLNILGK